MNKKDMSPKEKGNYHLCLGVLHNRKRKGQLFFLVNQSFFSMGVFLEQCIAVLDDNTGGTGFLIILVKCAFSIKGVSLNLPGYYPIYLQQFLELIEV